MFVGGKKSRKTKSRKSKSRSCEFYSVYTRKKVRVAKNKCCLRRIVMPYGRGVRYQLYAKVGEQKLYKFITADDAEHYKDCKATKTVVKNLENQEKLQENLIRKSVRKSHKAHFHRHKRGSLRKYGRKKLKDILIDTHIKKEKVEKVQNININTK